jgi:signal transduction histidine kinase
LTAVAAEVALIRDLHESFGSRLMSTLVALERGTMPSADVLEVLRECVDDSRIVIDSLEPLGHDVVVLLATMRHRLGPRLQAAGLNVRWEVQDLPLLPWLGPPQALQVMRIVQETLTNILKHAQASSVRIATRQTTDDGVAHVAIVIEDNGIGFDAAVRRNGRGLNHMKSRAQMLQSTIEVVSKRAKGTCVTLTMPASMASSSGAA